MSRLTAYTTPCFLVPYIAGCLMISAVCEAAALTWQRSLQRHLYGAGVGAAAADAELVHSQRRGTADAAGVQLARAAGPQEVHRHAVAVAGPAGVQLPIRAALAHVVDRGSDRAAAGRSGDDACMRTGDQRTWHASKGRTLHGDKAVSDCRGCCTSAATFEPRLVN